eukprot:gene5056-6294_t
MEYDLTKQICTFLDAHLMIYLLNGSQYPEDQVNKARADILAQTGCCDYAIDIYKKIGRDTTGLLEKKEQLVEQIAKLNKDCEVVTQYIELKKQPKQTPPSTTTTSTENKDTESKETTTTTTTTETTKETTTTTTEESTTTTPATPQQPQMTLIQLQDKVTTEMLDSLYKLAKVTFEVGSYGSAKDYLEVFLQLSSDRSKRLSALWGILESDILSGNPSAVNDIAPLKELIDSHGSPIEQLHQRAWLIHRSLFVYFKNQESKSMLVDLLLDDKYLNCVQTTCPHILRYLAVSIITSKKKLQSSYFQKQLYNLVRVIEQEAYTYRDPVTVFISSLFVKFDFEEAQNQLILCEKVLNQDFFFSESSVEDFMESARACVFETYCNIHETIDIDMLCKNLRISPEHSEKWIVEAIRNARFTAKIDSANNQIKMFSQHNNSYRHVMDKTKALFNRGIEIVVGINDSRSQQARKVDQSNKGGQKGTRGTGGQNRQQQQQQQQQSQTQPQQPQQPQTQPQQPTITA